LGCRRAFHQGRDRLCRVDDGAVPADGAPASVSAALRQLWDLHVVVAAPQDSNVGGALSVSASKKQEVKTAVLG